MTRSQVLEFISHLDGWLSSHEGYFLYEAAKNITVKGKIVEIGSWMGKSTICLAAGSQAGKAEKVYAIDPHKGEFSKGEGIGKKAPTFKAFEKNLKNAGVATLVKPIINTSEKASKVWDQPINLLFIDGLHDYKNTKLDFDVWNKKLNKNGVIAFHDAFCGHVGPKRVIQEDILPNNNWSGIGVVGSIIFAKKEKAESWIGKINLFRHRLLIPLASRLNESLLPQGIRFFLIHRVIKFLLLNTYTWRLQFEK